MLRKISFKNYKAFKSWQTIDLSSHITILVGPNSAGKSSIIKLLGLLKQSIDKKNSEHHLLNIRGPIFDMVDFESISYRKELKDLEIKISSGYEHIPSKNESPFLVRNIENRFLFTLSDTIESNEIKQKLISTELLNPEKNRPTPCKPNKIIGEKIIKPEKEQYVTLLLKKIQDFAFKEIKSQLSYILLNQLGKPGFFKNESDLNLFIKASIKEKIDVSIQKNGLIPGHASYESRTKNPWGEMNQLDEEINNKIKLSPYGKTFREQFKGFMERDHQNLKGTGSTIDNDYWIEFPFTFFAHTDFEDSWFRVVGYSYYPVNNRVVMKKNDTLDDCFNEIRDHYSSISEYVNNNKYSDYVSMQIHSYLNVILRDLRVKLRFGKKKDIFWQEALDQHLKNFRHNISNLFENIKFLPSLRPSPKKFHSRQDLMDSFAVTPDTNFSFWNKALIDMGFNYELSIEDVSRSHDLYAIKLKDTKTQVESYLDEVGYGFSQFLPYLGHKFNGHSKWCILEQPELHLHPDAQARLPEVLVKSYAINAGKDVPQEEQAHFDDSSYYLDKDKILQPSHGYFAKEYYSRIDGNSYLIETHSEHILRGVQLLVAKGLLYHNNVKIYYVGKHNNGNSYVKEHPLNEQGKFKDDWPKGFFDVGFNQAAELMRYNSK
tara:strand:- start:1227 stop:3203 length:1977 start_codon:yes stop_codon:yes gene_type:complete